MPKMVLTKKETLIKTKQGFTLVEIIVVLVILAILAAFTIPTMVGFVNEAKKKAYIAEARQVYVAAQAVATEYVGVGGSNRDLDFSTNNKTDALNSYHVSRINDPGVKASSATLQMKAYLAADFPQISRENYFGTYGKDEAYWYIEFDAAKTESARVTEVYYVKNGSVVRYRQEEVTIEALKPPNERGETPWGARWKE